MGTEEDTRMTPPMSKVDRCDTQSPKDTARSQKQDLDVSRTPRPLGREPKDLAGTQRVRSSTPALQQPRSLRYHAERRWLNLGTAVFITVQIFFFFFKQKTAYEMPK